jgi:MATE family multidrug resistance protein
VAPDPLGLNDPRPLWSLLKQAAPNVASMMSYTVMQFVDAYLVSRIGPDPVYVSAHGSGSIATIWPVAIGMGLIGMTNTYASQHVGAGTPRKAAPYAWNGLWLGVMLWVALLPYVLALPWIFSQLNHSPHLVELESEFAQIVLLGSVTTLCARGMAQFFYGIQRPGVVLCAVVAGNVTNFVCNYALIFGVPALGIPAMGLKGSAIGLVIGLAVEFAVPMAVFLGPKMNEKFGTRAKGAWRVSFAHIKDLAKTGWPNGLTYGSEMACWWVFMGVLAGRFGESQQTASWIVHRYMALSFMPAVGVSFAVTAIVGKCLGAGRPDLARQRAWLGMKCAMVYMSACALIMLLLRHELAAIFIKEGMPPEQQAEIMTYAARIMIVAAVFQVFDGLGITVFGVLRGAGDTLAPGIATAVLSWTCIVGVGWAMTEYYPQLGALGAWIGAGVYIVLMSLFLGWRYIDGAWMKKKLLDESAVAH